MLADAFELKFMRIGDVERVLCDVPKGSPLERQVKETSLRDGLSWVRSGADYLLGIHPGELEGAGQHYLLFLRGRVFEAQTRSSGSNRLCLVGMKEDDEAIKPEVERTFVSALKVYGRWGRGQDGHFNSQPGHADELVNFMDPQFQEPPHGEF